MPEGTLAAASMRMAPLPICMRSESAASSTRAWVAIWASIGAVVTGAVRARSTVRRNCSMRGPCSATHLSTVPSDRSPRAAPGIRGEAARSRGRGRRSAAAPTGRAPGNGWRRSAPSRARAPRRAWCRRGSSWTSSTFSFWPSMASPTAPFSSNSRTILRTMAAGAPISPSWPRRPPASARGLRPEQIVDHRRRAWRGRAGAWRPARPGSRSGEVSRSRSAMCSWRPVEACSNKARRTCSGRSARVELVPEVLHVEQPLGGEEGRRRLAEGGALFLGQREGRDDAEPVDEAVGDLGGDDLASSAGARGSRRLAAPASPAGRRPAVRGSRSDRR